MNADINGALNILRKSKLVTFRVLRGNGSHVKYFFTDGISRCDLKRWSELEKILCELFSEIGADIKATDITRVLRLPGTKNCKAEMLDRVADEDLRDYQNRQDRKHQLEISAMRYTGEVKGAVDNIFC